MDELSILLGIGDPLDGLDSASTAFTLCDEEEERLQRLEKRSYLLLDVRDEHDFEKFHIVTAESYPQSRLAR